MSPPLLPALSQIAQRAAHRYFAPGLDPDDLEQEGQLALLLALPHYDPARHGALEAYLAVSVRHRLYRLCRQAWRREARRAEMPADVEAPTPREDELADARAVVGRLLASLTPQQQQVLTLLSEGRKPRQIAADLGVTPASVHSTRYAALARLKEMLAGQTGRA
jgi:RNA polymerase sigma factor (sigma-70 family)